jgi:hypothetical protein
MAQVWSVPALAAAAAATAASQDGAQGPGPQADFRPQPLATLRLPPAPSGPQGRGGGAGRRVWVPSALLPGCDAQGGGGAALCVAMAAPWGHVLLFAVSLGAPSLQPPVPP